MNHTAIIEHESGLEYRRRSYVLHLLDDLHFSILNHGDHVLGINGYCLDAPRSIPAGGTEKGFSRPSMQSVERGLTLADKKVREHEAGRIIAEILAEESGNTQPQKGRD